MEITEAVKNKIIEKAKQIAETEDLALIRSVVCKFYKEGNHPSCYDPEVCNGCQDDEAVLTCRKKYLARIFKNPLLRWDSSFDAVKIREKRKVDEIQEMGLACNSCYIADKCPQKETDATCSIDWSDSVRDRTPKSLINKLIDIQTERVARAKLHEELDGGIPDQNLSVEIDRLHSLAEAKANIDSHKFSMKIESTSPEGAKMGGGILQRLFDPQNQQLSQGEDTKALPEAVVHPVMPTIDVAFTEENTGTPVKKKTIVKKASK